MSEIRAGQIIFLRDDVFGLDIKKYPKWSYVDVGERSRYTASMVVKVSSEGVLYLRDVFYMNRCEFDLTDDVTLAEPNWRESGNLFTCGDDMVLRTQSSTMAVKWDNKNGLYVAD